jgi:outer membrane receptor protein involved in Fe transport
MHGSAAVKPRSPNAQLMSSYSRLLVFAGPTATALALVLAGPAYAQVQEPPPEEVTSPAGGTVEQPAADPATAAAAEEYDDEGEAIVVTGVRRGTVIGDIPPENTLTSRDVRATGATDITELLEALAPQIGSARGRGGERPILLLNGQRISSFREMRDIPTEAIERVDILPGKSP